MIAKEVRYFLSAYLIQLGAAIFVGLVSFGVTVFIARHIGPVSFGIYSSAMAAGALITLLFDGGLRTLILRERSKPSHSFEFSTNDLPKLATSYGLISALIFSVIAFLYFQGDSLRLALATIMCFFVFELGLINSGILRGDGRMWSDAWFQCYSRLLTAIAVIALIISGGGDPWKIFVVWGTVGLFALVPYHDFWGRPIIRGLKCALYAALPFLLFELSITLYIRADILVLQYFGVDSSSIGEFAAAFKICETFVLVSAPFGLVVFRYFRIQYASGVNLTITLRYLLLLAILVGGLITLLMTAYSDLIADLIFGNQYPGTGDYLRVMALMILFIFPNMILNQFALATEKEHICMGVAIFSAVLNVGILVALVPSFGITLGPYLKVATEFIVFILMSLFLLHPRFDRIFKKR